MRRFVFVVFATINIVVVNCDLLAAGHGPLMDVSVELSQCVRNDELAVAADIILRCNTDSMSVRNPYLSSEAHLPCHLHLWSSEHKYLGDILNWTGEARRESSYVVDIKFNEIVGRRIYIRVAGAGSDSIVADQSGAIIVPPGKYWIKAVVDSTIVSQRRSPQVVEIAESRKVALTIASNRVRDSGIVHGSCVLNAKVVSSNVSRDQQLQIDCRIVNIGESRTFYDPFFRLKYSPYRSVAFSVYDTNGVPICQLFDPVIQNASLPWRSSWMYVSSGGIVGARLSIGGDWAQDLKQSEYTVRAMAYGRLLAKFPVDPNKNGEYSDAEKNSLEEMLRKFSDLVAQSEDTHFRIVQ